MSSLCLDGRTRPTIRRIVVAFACLLPISALALAELPAEVVELRQCIDANLPERTTVASVEIESFDARGGSQVIRSRIWSKQEENGYKSLNVRVDGPPELAGGAYLILERENRDDVFVFIPGLNKVRRMTGATAMSSLWGSDFSYEELKHLAGVASQGEYRLLPIETLSGRATHVLEVTLAAVEESPYERLLMRVDKETCVPISTDFFELGGKLRKQLVGDASKIIQVDGRWVGTEYQMTDVRDGTTSKLKLSAPRFDEDLSGRVFSPRLFHLGN